MEAIPCRVKYVQIGDERNEVMLALTVVVLTIVVGDTVRLIVHHRVLILPSVERSA